MSGFGQPWRGGAGGQKGGCFPWRSSASQIRVKTTNLMHSPGLLKPKSRQPPLRQSRIEVGRGGSAGDGLTAMSTGFSPVGAAGGVLGVSAPPASTRYWEIV